MIRAVSAKIRDAAQRDTSANGKCLAKTAWLDKIGSMNSTPHPVLLACSLLFVGFFALAPNAAAQSFGRKVVSSQTVSLNMTDTSPSDEISTRVINSDLTYYELPGRTYQLGTQNDTFVDANGNATVTRYSYQDKMEGQQAVGTLRYEVDANGNLANPEDWAVFVPPSFTRGSFSGDRLVGGWRNVAVGDHGASYVVSALIVQPPEESITITTQATATDYPIGTDGYPVPPGTTSEPCTTSQVFPPPFNPNPQISTALDFCMTFYEVAIQQSSVE